MLAKETDEPFSSPDWIYEIKWDGYRAMAALDGSQVSLYSRNGNSFMNAYPVVVQALQEMNIHAVLDGEVVVIDDSGRSSFQMLQHYEDGYPTEYRVFDVLSIDGKDTCELPLLERKRLLKALIKGSDVVKYSEHISGKGVEFFNAAKARDLEGIMAKKADSLYHPGTRTGEWLKIKNHKSREAIIAGFTEPAGSRKHFGALVLGTRDGKKLRYIGHTGTGFDTNALKDLSKTLERLVTGHSPFEERIKTNMPVTWVKPVLVCEVKYSEITSDGLMRHPVFLRLRDDKQAKDVTMNATVKTRPVKKVAVKKSPAKAAKKEVRCAVQPVKKTPGNANGKKAGAASTMAFGKIKVNVTNLQKIYFPKEGISKGDVIDYYISISEYILPYLKDRPESLKRNPNGISDKGFFHKDAGDEAPAWVKSKPLFSESANKDIDYIICNNQPTLTYLNNLGCIELNPWHSTLAALDRPDYMIIDIDPSAKNTFEQVIEAARVVYGILDKAGATSFCKTSGATGLHIYVPTQKKYTYDQLKDFAHLVCVLAQQQLPSFTSLERNLQKRGNKMIYLDHLQNRRGQTIACAYSLRPQEGATVSMPLEWKEVKRGLSPAQFTIHNALERIRKKGDIFSGVLGKGIDLESCLENLEKD